MIIVDPAVGEWAAVQLKRPIIQPFTAVGYVLNGEIRGAAIFNGWNGANLDITIVGPGCLTRENIRYVYRYAFLKAKAQRLTARTSRRHKAMKDLLPRLGFRFESVAKLYYPKEDALVFRLLPEDARKWMEDGHAKPTAAPRPGSHGGGPVRGEQTDGYYSSRSEHDESGDAARLAHLQADWNLGRRHPSI